MRLWNISGKEIRHLYNNNLVVIPPNTISDYSDDLATFLLSKREIRGLGLVQFKEGDSKVDRYKEARLNIYKWASEKYSDFERHCEERESGGYKSLKPHEPIVEYKKTIDEYETWVAEGSLVGDEIKGKEDKKLIYGCPYCNQEFPSQSSLRGHLISHQEKDNVNTSSTNDTGSGKS